MKILKVILLGIWVLCIPLFILGFLTPLDFTYKWILYFTFMISFNGIFLLSFLLTDFIKFKINRAIIAFVCSVLLMLTYYFYPSYGTGWQTQQILYRQKDNPDNMIVFQEEQLGSFGTNHRVIKIINITPLFEWKIPMQKVQADSTWVEVNERITSK
jgi:hypothetical protein